MSDLLGFMLFRGSAVPPSFPDYPHRLVLLPHGVAVGDIGDPGHHESSIYLVDAGAAHTALDSPALDGYLRRRVPITIHCQRARDMRPFLRRAEQFKRRGFAVQVLPEKPA